MSYFVGIDPAADDFTAAVLEGPEELLAGPVTFANTEEGFQAFSNWLEANGVGARQALICVENTGVYSEALCYALEHKGYRLALLDPGKVWKAFKQDRKTDALDSQKIAEYGYRYRDRVELWSPHEQITEQVKTLLSTREQLVQQKTATQNSRKALGRKHIQTPAANQALEETIEHLKAQIQAIEREIRRLIDQHPTAAQMVALVTSAPGVGLLLGAHMLVLTNAFTEEPRYRKLANYLGICPHEHQSGTSVRRKARSRRYGPSIVRKLLYLSAMSIRTHSTRFKKYFLRKRQEGKPKKLVLNNIANKLLRILCGMIKNKEPYIENYQSIHPKHLTRS